MKNSTEVSPSLPLGTWFVRILIALICAKILFAFIFPVIGDEAYYFFWGRHFAGGYYDLSPMIGWWEAIFTKVSLNSAWLRLPNLIVMGVVSFAMKEWLSTETTATRAKLITLLYFFSPLPFLAILISPDVPLVLFSFLSAFSFYHAMRTKNAGSQLLQFFLSGALWGAALLSKYFAFFLLPAFGLWFLFRKDSKPIWRRPWLGLMVFALGAVPFLFQHLYWNATHCWANILFNFVVRQNVYDGPLVQTFGLYLVYLVLLATPFLIKDAFQKTKQREANSKDLRLFLLLSWSVPIFLFGLTALRNKGQGLHWYFSYVPFFFMWLGLKLSSEELEKRLRLMVKVTCSFTALALLVLLFPNQTVGAYFKSHNTADFQTTFHPKEWVDEVIPHLTNASAVMSDNYSMSSVLDHQLQKYYASRGEENPPPTNVWGDGSRFGRTYDWTMDWRTLEGKKLVIVTRGNMATDRWKSYFSELKVFPVIIGEGSLKSLMYVSEGYGFRAKAFHDEIFENAVNLYYPNWNTSSFPVFNLFPNRCSIK